MVDEKLLKKYLAGKTNESETQAALAFIADDSSDLDLLRKVLDQYSPTLSTDENQPVRLEIELLNGLRSDLYPEYISPVVHRDSFTASKKWYMIAAALVILIASGAIYFVSVTNLSTRISAIAALPKTIINETAANVLYTLPDSSKVWLNPNSRISYTDSFRSGPQRIVRLEGEAFFDIAANAARPFIVTTGHVQTRVLGTAFNVESYSNENIIRISLVRGKVAVADEAMNKTGTMHVLDAGHMLTYNRTSRKGITETLSPMNERAWTDGSIIMNNLPIRAALQRICERYKLKLTLENGVDLSGKQVSGLFRNHQLEEMLRIIFFVSQYKYELKGNTLTIRS